MYTNLLKWHQKKCAFFMYTNLLKWHQKKCVFFMYTNLIRVNEKLCHMQLKLRFCTGSSCGGMPWMFIWEAGEHHEEVQKLAS
jgi:hypothetical protein